MSQSSSTSSSMPPSSQIPTSSSYSRESASRPAPTPAFSVSTTSRNCPAMAHPSLQQSSSTLSQASTCTSSIPLSQDTEERPSSPCSSRDSPPPSLSTITTPVIPQSGANPMHNPFPLSPSLTASAAGSKRTASGTVKPTLSHSASMPSSPATPATPRLARSQTSVDISPRNITQVISTRAQNISCNNWTTESLEQLEARVAQRQGPTSTSPRFHAKHEPSFGEDHTSGYGQRRHHARTASEPNSANPIPESISSGGGDGGGRTYESFWRTHQANPIATKILQAKAASQALGSSTNTNFHAPPFAPQQSYARAALQPPAPIVPDRDRRSYYHPTRHAPTLTQSTSNLSTYSNYSTASTASMVPNTPPPAPSAVTAAQRSMEQDAVESLMFLSSPGNSRQSSQQTINHSTQHSQPSQPAPVAYQAQRQRQHHDPAPPPPPPQIRFNYAQNATTWPRSRRSHKHQRTGLLGQLGNEGAVVEDDVTDEELDREYADGNEKSGRWRADAGRNSEDVDPPERAAIEEARGRALGNRPPKAARVVSAGAAVGSSIRRSRSPNVATATATDADGPY
ncbi:hypothetical protein RUND412_009259 [Rhizina undulata]